MNRHCSTFLFWIFSRASKLREHEAELNSLEGIEANRRIQNAMDDLQANDYALALDSRALSLLLGQVVGDFGHTGRFSQQMIASSDG